MKTIRLVFTWVLLRERNSSPSTGMSPSTGIFSSVRRSASSSNPPRATISPSPTVTVVRISRLFTTSSPLVEDTGPATELTCWRKSSRTAPASPSPPSNPALPPLIWGVTSSSIPTFWRWIVRKAPASEPESASPVATGISFPNRIEAGTLSFVTMCGVESTLELLSEWIASISAPKKPVPPSAVAQPAMPPRAASAACAALLRKLSPSVELVEVVTVDPLITVVVWSSRSA